MNTFLFVQESKPVKTWFKMQDVHEKQNLLMNRKSFLHLSVGPYIKWYRKLVH